MHHTKGKQKHAKIPNVAVDVQQNYFFVLKKCVFFFKVRLFNFHGLWVWLLLIYILVFQRAACYLDYHNPVFMGKTRRFGC